MYKINVMMSVFNGEEYLMEQIESIMNQKSVDVKLTIRDDGSVDNSLDVIKKLQARYENKIVVYKGNNIGYRASFMRLLLLSSEADFYAFSDQDDVWMPDKCINAICRMQESGSDKMLYMSSLTITDKNLIPLFEMDYSKAVRTLEGYFVRQRYAGCTYVFSRTLKQLCERFAPLFETSENMPDHDFVVGACAFACGSVFIDNSPTNIFHRRLDTSVTSGGNGIIKRIKVEYNLVFRRKNIQSFMAEQLLKLCPDEINESKKIFLRQVNTYRKNYKSKLKLIKNPKFTSGIKICDLEAKFKVLISTF